MEILDFFLFLWIIFALLDPDPATQINADPCGSGSETLRGAQIHFRDLTPYLIYAWQTEKLYVHFLCNTDRYRYYLPGGPAGAGRVSDGFDW